MADYPREPRNYELMVILLPELADEALTSTIDRVSGYVTSVGAEVREVLQDSPWGRRRLAYTIRFNGTDYRDGYYVIWHFSSVPNALGDLERDLKLDTSVIRHLLVIEDPRWGSPQEREAAREAANAPAEVEETAVVADSGDVAADVEVTEEVVEVVETADGEEVIEAVGVAEVVETPDGGEEVIEVVEAVEVAPESEPVADTSEAGETVDAETAEETK